MTHSALRLGVLGARWVGHQYIKAVPGLSGVRLVAVADADHSAIEGIRPDSPQATIYADYRELLDKEKLDAVIIALPTFLHEAVTIECLQRGLHVLCEKPPACDLAEMLNVAAKVKETGLTYMFGRQDRFSPEVNAARKLVAEGALGTLCGAQAQWIRVRGPQLRTGGWRVMREKGGGVLLDLGIHGLDTIWFAMGCPAVVEVSATDFAAFREHSADPVAHTADDGAAGWIRFANGAICQYKFAFGMNVAGPWLVGKDKELTRATEWKSCRIYGTHAGVDIYEKEVIAGSVDEVEIRPLLDGKPARGAFQLQLEEFLSAIRERRTPLNSVEHGVQLMQILSALRESAEKGHSISFRPRHGAHGARLAQLENAALGYNDTPVLVDSGYRVHDGTRPQPPVVTPSETGTLPPSDAVILFDGTDLSKWEAAAGGDDAKWTVKGGFFEVVPKTGNIRTREHFGSMQLHLEFAAPAEVKGTGQGRGNSGIFLMGQYEIQVLDNYENPTYADGTVGAVYGQYPPLVNAMRKPGEWNSVEILWTAPAFENKHLISPACVTVLLNGIAVQHATILQGPTEHRKLTSYKPHPAKGPLMLQDHGDLVRFRNIWVRPL